MRRKESAVKFEDRVETCDDECERFRETGEGKNAPDTDFTFFWPPEL